MITIALFILLIIFSLILKIIPVNKACKLTHGLAYFTLVLIITFLLSIPATFFATEKAISNNYKRASIEENYRNSRLREIKCKQVSEMVVAVEKDRVKVKYTPLLSEVFTSYDLNKRDVKIQKIKGSKSYIYEYNASYEPCNRKKSLDYGPFVIGIPELFPASSEYSNKTYKQIRICVGEDDARVEITKKVHILWE